MVAAQRGSDLRIGSLPASPLKLRELHAQGQHAFHARALLARDPIRRSLTKVKSARFLASGQKIDFHQDPYRVRFTGLPEQAPDHPVTTLALECDAEPTQDNIFVREEKPRDGV